MFWITFGSRVKHDPRVPLCLKHDNGDHFWCTCAVLKMYVLLMYVLYARPALIFEVSYVWHVTLGKQANELLSNVKNIRNVLGK